MATRLEHAERNLALCKQLLVQGVYYDWVVTTAFYSSIHFVEHKLFVLEAGNCGFSSTEDYKIKNKLQSPHQARLILVIQHLYPISRAYKELEIASRKARYSNYATTPTEANTSLQQIEMLRSHCI